VFYRCLTMSLLPSDDPEAAANRRARRLGAFTTSQAERSVRNVERRPQLRRKEPSIQLPAGAARVEILKTVQPGRPLHGAIRRSRAAVTCSIATVPRLEERHVIAGAFHSPHVLESRARERPTKSVPKRLKEEKGATRSG